MRFPCIVHHHVHRDLCMKIVWSLTYVPRVLLRDCLLLCFSGNPTLQQLWVIGGLAAVMPVVDPSAPQERLHQDVGEWPQSPALRGRHGESAGQFLLFMRFSWWVAATVVVSHGVSVLLRLSVMVSQRYWGCQSWWVSAAEAVSHGESVLLRLSVMVSWCCSNCHEKSMLLKLPWWVSAVADVMVTAPEIGESIMRQSVMVSSAAISLGFERPHLPVFSER